MRHLVSGNDDTDALRVEHTPLGIAYPSRNEKEMSDFGFIEIEPLVDLANGNDQRMTRREGIDRQK